MGVKMAKFLRQSWVHKRTLFVITAVGLILATAVVWISCTTGRNQPSIVSMAANDLPIAKLTRYTRNPLLRNGPEPYDFDKTGPRVVLKLGLGYYRMWYEAVAGDGLTTVGYATSADGLMWNKEGVVISPSEAWEKEEISPNSILLEDGVFKMWYHGGGYIRDKRRLGNGRIGYATSTDGISWTKYKGNPVVDIGPAGSFDDIQVAEPRVFHFSSGYRMYYTGQNGSTNRTSLGMASSPDGIHWIKYEGNPILNREAWGGFWGGAFFPENGIWHLWHGVIIESGDRQSTSHDDVRSGLGYMWSADGLSWKDGMSNPVLVQNADREAADHGLVGDSVSGYRDGDTYRIMYTGFNSNLFGKLGRFEGICLATIEATHHSSPTTIKTTTQ